MNIFSNIYRNAVLLYERRFEPERLRVLAENYWRLLLSAGLIGAAAVVAFGVLQFINTLESLSSAGVLGTTPSVALDRMKLEEALSLYAKKQADYSATQRSSATYHDPSN